MEMGTRKGLPFWVVVGLFVLSVEAHDNFFYLDWTVSFSQFPHLGNGKQVITINNQFPGPLLNLTTNNVIKINVHNNLTEPFLFTWNGVQQRRNSWQDGVQGTNCPIMPRQNWTYEFQVKDQIGTFFYSPSLLFQKAAGGYGAIRVNNRAVIAIPFSKPEGELDILIGDWYDYDYRDLRTYLDIGSPFPSPDTIIINGMTPYQAKFTFQPGATYLLRISNVGLKASLNFRIQNHTLTLVETEGSYTLREQLSSLDIHVGQSYSVLVTADQTKGAYYMIASSKFQESEMAGVAVFQYSGFNGGPGGPLPAGPDPLDYSFSLQQARSIRWDLNVGAARPNPQGSFHYGQISLTRTIVLENGKAAIGGFRRYTVNNISFEHPDTPLKLADYFQIGGVFTLDAISDKPDGRQPALAASVITAKYRDFIQVVFQNTQPTLQVWHTDGYSAFVVGMGDGRWNESKNSTYNLVDAVCRSTFQVYPNSWTAIQMELDNMGMWNLRSQDAEKQYLGQQLYLRVKDDNTDPAHVSPRDELPMPSNAIRCGKASTEASTPSLSPTPVPAPIPTLALIPPPKPDSAAAPASVASRHIPLLNGLWLTWLFLFRI